ncbi:MAG: homing endonuclease associated repeat-containing protein [Candidatus Acidiferrum sp.]
MPDKQEIVSIIAKIAKKLGRAPSEKEFNALSDVSSYYVLQRFRSWNDTVRASRLRPYTLNIRPKQQALLEDWGKAARRHRGVPPRRAYAREGKYNPATLEKRFGPWSRLPEAFRNFAKAKREWADVLALLPGPLPRGRAPRKYPQHPLNNSSSSAPARETFYAHRKGRRIYGTPTPFRWLPHEPLNEQGVVLLFGMLAKNLGYVVENAQTGFPDCEAMRQIAPARWQRLSIEFEFESRNFRDHGHPSSGCDLIVCWRHNWEDCPRHIEVVELSSIVRALPEGLR